MLDRPPVPSVTSRRDFLRKGAAAAIALPAVATLAACTDTNSRPGRRLRRRRPLPRAPSRRPSRRPTRWTPCTRKASRRSRPRPRARATSCSSRGSRAASRCTSSPRRRSSGRSSPAGGSRHGPTTGRCRGRRSGCARATGSGSSWSNKLSQSTAIHFHGLELPNDQDGVPFITQPPVKPGESYTYEFTVPNAGLAHVPLAPQRRDPGGQRPARRVHRRAQAAARGAPGRRGLRDGAERWGPRLHAQRQGLPRHRAGRLQAGSDGAHPVHERGDDDPPDAPARDAHDGDRQGRVGPAGARGSATRSTSRRASGGTCW